MPPLGDQHGLCLHSALVTHALDVACEQPDERCCPLVRCRHPERRRWRKRPTQSAARLAQGIIARVARACELRTRVGKPTEKPLEPVDGLLARKGWLAREVDTEHLQCAGCAADALRGSGGIQVCFLPGAPP